MCNNRLKMRFSSFVFTFLQVATVIVGQDILEEGLSNEVEEEEYTGVNVTLSSPQNNSIQIELENVLKRLEFLEKAARQGFIYTHNRLDAMEEQVELNKNSLSTTDSVTRTCGGFLELSEVHSIIYRVPDEAGPGDYVVCLWVVWANKGGPITVRSVYNELAEFHPSSRLTVTYNFTVSDGYAQELELSEEATLAGHFVGIFFSATLTERGQGVHLQLWDGGEAKSELSPTVIFFPPDDGNSEDEEEENSWIHRSAQQFTYPEGEDGAEYGPNEKLFIVGNSIVPGSLLNLTISSINTEECCDWITLVFMNPETPDLIISELRRGTTEVEDMRAILDDSMPFFIFFSSDELEHGKGFKMSYQYFQP